MKQSRKLIAIFLCIAMLFTTSAILIGCNPTEIGYTDEDIYTPGEYSSVYSEIGKKVSIEDVRLNGYKATVTVEGKEYELGMDFLSMAMVYNTTPKANPSPAFDTPLEIYNEWWKLYMLRWNYLLPEIPLYSNIYYDVYNAKLDKLETSPYWSVDSAIIDSKVISGTNTITLGQSTELSGLFRVANFGKASPGSADLAIQRLTNGYATVEANNLGVYVWADDVVKSHVETYNADGTKTFEITIADDLTFSDGSPITAKNYLTSIMAGSTAVNKGAGGSASAGLNYTGYKSFNAYEGVAKAGATKEFSGIRLLDTYTFSVTVDEVYYYDILYAGFNPHHTKMYLGEFDILDDGNGCYLSDGFYEKTSDDKFKHAETIKKNVTDNLDATSIPYSGPYTLKNYDSSNRIATLSINPLYKGDIRGKASIDQILYIKIEEATQADLFRTGGVDVLGNLTGTNAIRAALALVTAEPTKYKETHYGRAGYGKLALRSDFGPTMFAEVRQAIAYSIDREYFATAFTSGYGMVVNGPYCDAIGAYQANKSFFETNLAKYSVSESAAVSVLKEGGWIYNADGTDYVDGSTKVRYKKLAKEEQIEFNLMFHSQDNKYKTVKVEDSFYMPLIINWTGTTPNTFSDLLITNWAALPIIEKIGMRVQYSLGDFNSVVYGEYQQGTAFGWNGDPVYNACNFATGFTSTIYDYSYNWTIDEDLYDDYSICYLKDSADYIWR